MLFLLRKIGKFLRGSSSPFQIYSATLLAGWLGFSNTGISALGLNLLLFAAAIILNANLFVAGISLLIFKVLFWLLLPVLFQAGIWLLHGPLESTIGTLSGLPVLAWFGLDLYIQVPGLFLGTVLGILWGTLLVRSLRKLRRMAADLEGNEEKWAKLNSSLWIRSLAWVFMGGLKGKKSWKELAETEKGLPVRPIGIVLVILLFVFLWTGWKFFDTNILTTQLQAKLEPINGATVDVGSLSIEPGSQKIVLEGIAFANPENLMENRFEAERLVLNLSGIQFLSKRMELDSLEILGGALQTPRTFPGIVVLPKEEPEEVKKEKEAEEAPSLYDYLEDAAVWKSRLETASRWIERINGLRKEDTADAEDGGLSWKERLAMRAEETGYANVVADHLRRPHPRLVIHTLQAEPFRVGDEEPSWKMEGENLASEPFQSDRPGFIKVEHIVDPISLRLEMPNSMEAWPGIQASLKNLVVEELRKASGGKLPLRSGEMDISLDGSLNPGALDLPLRIVVRDSSLEVAGKSVPLQEIEIPVTLRGTLRQPRIAVDPQFTENLLKNAAEGKVRSLIEEKAGDKLKKLFPFGGG